MKLLAWVHMAAPLHGAGAEWMLHSLFAEMVKRGHECEIVAAYASGSWTLDGVCIHGAASPGLAECMWEWCDLAVTHLDKEREACNLATTYDRPLIHLAHNARQLQHNAVPAWHPVIFNSWSLADANGPRTGPVYIIPPPVDAWRYQVGKIGDSNVLVNMSAEKGAKTFYALARALPEQRFLGVMGAYGTQLVERHHQNVRLIPQQPDMRRVFAEAKVVLMPSVMETYGRVAIEAAVNGLPVIAHPTPGLEESLGSAGIFHHRDDVGAWAASLRFLHNAQGEWNRTSRRMLKRSRELDPTPAYDLFAEACEEAIARG